MRTALAIALMFLIGCSGDPKPEQPSGVPVSYSFEQRTPKGARTFAPFRLSDDQLGRIDAGLDLAFYAARTSGYSRKLEHSFYDIFTPRDGCQPDPVTGTPAFRVYGSNYGGYVWAVEMVRNATAGEMVVCPDESVLQIGVQFGAEHIAIFHNDFSYYKATQTHGPPHPLLPKN